MRYRLDVVAPSVLDAVRYAGGWIYDRVMAGWDVTVLVGGGDDDMRPLQILGAQTLNLDSLWCKGAAPLPHIQSVYLLPLCRAASALAWLASLATAAAKSCAFAPTTRVSLSPTRRENRAPVSASAAATLAWAVQSRI